MITACSDIYAQFDIRKSIEKSENCMFRLQIYNHETIQFEHHKACSGQADLKWSCQSMCKSIISVAVAVVD